jgi:hypothetical protein
MGTIGLAHRAHRDFVVDWLEPDVSTIEPDEGLTSRVEIVRDRARAGDPERPERPGGPYAAPRSVEPDEAETWLAGEPTF